MWTKIENYLKQNRQEIDVEQAPAGLWDKLEKELHPAKPWYLQGRYLSIAATVLVVAGAAFFLLKQDHIERQVAAIPEGAVEFSEWQAEHPELREAEYFFTSASAEIRNEIDGLLPEGDEKAYAFIGDLEGAYEDLKTDAAESGLTEPVIEAMINNYRLRILLLEKLLKELRRADDKSQISSPNQEIQQDETIIQS